MENREISIALELLMCLLALASGMFLCANMVSQISDFQITMLFFCYFFITFIKLLISVIMTERTEAYNHFYRLIDPVYPTWWGNHAYIIESLLYYMYNYGIAIPLYNITSSIYKSDLEQFKKTDTMTFTAYYVIGILVLILLVLALMYYIIDKNSSYFSDRTIERLNHILPYALLFCLPTIYIIIIIFACLYSYKHFEIKFYFPVTVSTFDEIVFTIQFILTLIRGMIRMFICNN